MFLINALHPPIEPLRVNRRPLGDRLKKDSGVTRSRIGLKDGVCSDARDGARSSAPE